LTHLHVQPITGNRLPLQGVGGKTKPDAFQTPGVLPHLYSSMRYFELNSFNIYIYLLSIFNIPITDLYE
jgi:hypothetical protein